MVYHQFDNLNDLGMGLNRHEPLCHNIFRLNHVSSSYATEIAKTDDFIFAFSLIVQQFLLEQAVEGAIVSIRKLW
jgi:hypothetical protein